VDRALNLPHFLFGNVRKISYIVLLGSAATMVLLQQTVNLFPPGKD